MVIVVVILLGTWDLIRESLDMALDAVPRGLDVAAVRAHLEALPGVEAVHDLHIWAMSATPAFAYRSSRATGRRR